MVDTDKDSKQQDVEKARELALSYLDSLWDVPPEAMLEAVAEAWMRDITPDDIDYLRSQYPHLQIVNLAAAVQAEGGEPPKTELIEVPGGWKIHCRGESEMTASPGDKLWGGKAEEGDDGEGGKGTIIKQAYRTAVRMIKLAKERGWGGAKVVDGDEVMQWAAWMAAEDLQDFNLEGYTSTEEAKAKRERVLQERKAAEEARAGKSPGRR